MLSKKLKSSTLIETVVAMTILMIFVFLSMMIMANVNKKNNANVKIRAHLVSDYFLQYTLSQKRFIDEDFKDAGMYVEKTIEELNENAILIKIEIFNADTVLVLDKKQIHKMDKQDI